MFMVLLRTPPFLRLELLYSHQLLDGVNVFHSKRNNESLPIPKERWVIVGVAKNGQRSGVVEELDKRVPFGLPCAVFQQLDVADRPVLGPSRSVEIFRVIFEVPSGGLQEQPAHVVLT